MAEIGILSLVVNRSLSGAFEARMLVRRKQCYVTVDASTRT